MLGAFYRTCKHIRSSNHVKPVGSYGSGWKSWNPRLESSPTLDQYQIQLMFRTHASEPWELLLAHSTCLWQMYSLSSSAQPWNCLKARSQHSVIMYSYAYSVQNSTELLQFSPSAICVLLDTNRVTNLIYGNKLLHVSMIQLEWWIKQLVTVCNVLIMHAHNHDIASYVRQQHILLYIHLHYITWHCIELHYINYMHCLHC